MTWRRLLRAGAARVPAARSVLCVVWLVIKFTMLYTSNNVKKKLYDAIIAKSYSHV